MTNAPDKLVPPLNDAPEIQAYFTALGHFIDNFSWAENALLSVVIVLARIGDAKIARAMLRDTRVNAMRDMINRLFEARATDVLIVAAYKRLSDQLGEIASARNDIVHSGLSFGPNGEFEVKNTLAALAGSLKPRPMPTESLRDMAADLETIIIRMLGLARWIASGEPAFNADQPPSWRYKPPAQRPKKKADSRRS